MRRKIHIDGHGAPGDEPNPIDPRSHAGAQYADAPASDPAQAVGAQDGPPAPGADEPGTAESTATYARQADVNSEIAALREQVEQLTREVEQERSQHLRALADFQNFRRRREEEGLRDRQFANRELIIALLPILDNFERALAAAEQSQSYDALIGGVKLTLRQLQEFLKKNGVEPIDAVGREFDPNLHEAVMRVEDGDAPENTIVEELQRGYTMHDRVVRPSMVKVAHGS